MRNVGKALLMSTVLLLAGCTSVVGSWTLESITPAEAGEHYTLANMMLRNDGTYCARAKKAGEDVTSTGNYTFQDNQLCFNTADGKTRTYDATLIAMGSKMEVKTTFKDTEVTTVMKRGKRCGGCSGARADCCGACGKCKKCCRCGKAKTCGPNCTKKCCKK